MLNQSFRQVFVTNTSVLLPSGSTEDLAVSQIGIFDGNTYAATTTPTYGTNKALQISQGMPDTFWLPLMAGIPQTNQHSKLIKGKLISKFRKKTAHEGQTQKIAIGFDGYDVTKTLSAKCGEKKAVYLKLTGNPIDKIYSVQGLIRQYWLDTGFCDDCGSDNCADVDPSALADQLVAKINADPRLKFNSYTSPGVVLASKVLSTALSTAGAIQNTTYTLAIPDSGNNAALATVAVQYPGENVTRISRDELISTYQIILPTSVGTPSAFSNANVFTLPNCGTCPSGYTSNAQGFVYVVNRADAGDSGALATLKSDYTLTAPGETAVRTAYNSPAGISTYIIVSNTEGQAAVGTDSIVSYGSAVAVCTISSPTTIAWTVGETLYQFPQNYTLTLEDTVCGTSRLAELQAYYPDQTITQSADGPVACIHQYATTIYSNPVSASCTIEELYFPPLAAFGQSSWDVVPGSIQTGVSAGVIIETAFVNRITGECTYLYYPYEADTIHLQVSQYNEDYDASPAEVYWPVTEIQSVQYPVGVGARVRDEEVKSLGYFLKDYSLDPAVREAEGYAYYADPFQLYDEYTLHFDFTYKVLGWSQHYTDSYQLVVFFPTGGGQQYEQAILGYIESLGGQVDVEFD
jgi:hypothetical protein